jgi:hypothetical protein
MTTYTDFDDGGTGSEGPWLTWHPQLSRDGTIPACSWSLRDASGERTVTDAPMRFMVLDLASLKTAWERTSGVPGVAPERRWNASISKFEPRPGPEWKKAHSIAVAFDQENAATWEQAGLASWIGLVELMKLVWAEADTKFPLLPLLRCTGHRPIDTRRGGTSAPTFELLKWVPRPAILGASAPAAFDAVNGAPTASARPSDRVSPQAGPKAPSPASHSSSWFVPASPQAARPPQKQQLIDDDIPF